MKNKAMCLLIYGFVSLLFSLEALAQSRQDTGLAEEQRGHTFHRQRIDFDKSIVNLSAGKYPTAAGAEYIRKFHPDADLVRYPPIKYGVDTAHVGFLLVGERIPDDVLDRPLRVVNHVDAVEYVTLRDYMGKEWLILDNWAEWCAPCVKSMDVWEELMPQIRDKVTVLGLHLDFDYKAPLVAQRRNWSGVQIIGGEALVLSRYFMGQNIAGPSIWIHDGKLWAISSIREKDRQVILDIVNGRLESMPEQFSISDIASRNKEVKDGD